MVTEWRSSYRQDINCLTIIMNQEMYRHSRKEYLATQMMSGEIQKTPLISRTTIDYREPRVPCTNDLVQKIQHRNTRYVCYVKECFIII